jgi:phosphoribosylformylglycinamidine (FGAM) synthase-like enzyme
VSDGGLAIALAESSFGAAGVGAALDLDSDLRPEFLLFHEGPSRIVISTGEPEKIAAIARRHNVEAPSIGVTIEKELRITNRGAELLRRPVATLQRIFEEAFEKKLRR